MLMPSVIISAVTAKDALHGAADRFLLAFEQQMDVVGHQTIGIKKMPDRAFSFARRAKNL